MDRPAVLIILPCGLAVGGVTSWAVRLANGLCERYGGGRRVGLVLHRTTPGSAAMAAGFHAGLRVFDLSAATPVESANGDVGELAKAYRDVVLQVGGSAVLLPSLLGDCYGACAALTSDASLDVRLIGWAHSENGYDARVLEHYAPALSLAGAVSERLANEVRRRWVGREADVKWIPTGVESGGERISLGPRRTVVYTGRMDEGVKRVGALVHMSDTLARRSVPHELRIVGDGPAGAAIDRLIEERKPDRTRRLERVANASPSEIRKLLRESEFFVLPSRFEGLSISMLEAMSEGCCCVVTAENSGAREAIADGESGILLATTADATAERAGEDLAQAIVAIPRERAKEIGDRARIVASTRFSLAAQVRAVSDVIDEAAMNPARRWPRDREAAFTARPGTIGSGTVPRDADVRLRLVMDGLRGRSVAVHGTGRHSVELMHVLGEYALEIRAFVDDDPARQGGAFMGKPVVAPGVLARIGATDVVISSHLHQEAIWAKRDEYERAGVRVHRLYA
ncbi:MAG: glycosyltransferase family 4 protein [Phycisphaeraceae bacterium]|nr:glycosyltransferase family 4 protein [Phycisphaeraceae bacterium]